MGLDFHDPTPVKRRITRDEKMQWAYVIMDDGVPIASFKNKDHANEWVEGTQVVVKVRRDPIIKWFRR